MNKNFAVLGVMISVALLGSGCSTTPKPAAASAQKSDLAMLQGTWKGHVPDATSPVPFYLIISGNDLEFRGSEGNEWYRGTISLMDGANPRRMEVTITDSTEAQYVGRLAHAIYRFEDAAAVTIAGNEPGNPDVPAFDAPGVRQATFKRK